MRTRFQAALRSPEIPSSVMISPETRSRFRPEETMLALTLSMSMTLTWNRDSMRREAKDVVECFAGCE